jgi:hypothetical protein
MEITTTEESEKQERNIFALGSNPPVCLEFPLAV